MQSPRYALVGYLDGPIAEFIRQIRRDLHPELPHLAAHVTILPPRVLCTGEEAAIAAIVDGCRQVEPFDVRLGEVETFIPVTPTVFIRIVHAYRMRELHNQLVVKQPLSMAEEWPYLPHLTIVKLSSEAQAQEAYRLACSRWKEYSGPRCLQVKDLTFVREQQDASWVDVTTIPLVGAAARETS